jgi:hypothetical protein
VLDLYGRLFNGIPLAPDEYVISADEKSQLQVLFRRHLALVAAPGRVRRVEFEYQRHGTRCYLAAHDVHAARLFGSVAEKSGIAPVVKPADFADAAELADRLTRFEARYDETAHPFDWLFTTKDLTALLERLEPRAA